jgi:uncharacterized RDD family membrane protein YckC
VVVVGAQRRKEHVMAQGVSGAPTALEVHVTGRRVLATLVDGIVLGIVFTIMSILFGSSSAEGGAVSASLGGLASLVYFLIVVAYYILLEGYLGQTVGKMLLGIKVVREGTGELPGLGGAAIRTILRLVDGFFFYAVAFITVLISGKNQRLGDMAANTLVVRK